jgi:23S rRNA (uracil1939-C5)-methyltransferase
MAEMHIKIEKLIYGGDGLAHHNGSTVFVPFVLPAECVAATSIEQKKKFVRARAEHILEASPERTAARCPHFGTCGGCNYQHISTDAQVQYKTAILRETLWRIGRIDWPGEILSHGSPPWGYRNRAQWKVRPAESGAGRPEVIHTNASSSSNLGIGYFQANSTALCAVEDCAILSQPLRKTLLALHDVLSTGILPRALREIEAFAAPSPDASQSKLLLTVTFAGFPSRSADVAEKIRSAADGLESLLLYDPSHERMELFGPGFVRYETGGIAYRVGHFSFFQVNDSLVAELIREVVEREEEGRFAFDLFAGVGLFTVPLAKRFEHVVAVESNPAAARDLEANTHGNGPIEVRPDDVEQFLEKHNETPDLVVLDPPRSGLTPASVTRLTTLAPARVTYVSCEPPTLARDLKTFLDAGYEVSEVHLFDLFPQTFHMEAVVRLRRHT